MLLMLLCSVLCACVGCSINGGRLCAPWDTSIECLNDCAVKDSLCHQTLSTESRTFCSQIELREREIQRLSLALDGGCSPDVLSLETRNKTNEKLIAHLNVQVMALRMGSLTI